MKFLYGYFDQETGKSQVGLVDKYGRYIGYAYLHPDDKNNASRFMGCRLAQQRAWIKGLQTRRRVFKLKIQTIIEVYKDLQKNCDISEKGITQRFYYRIKCYDNEIKELEQQIQDIKNDIKKRIQMRDKITKKNNPQDI